MPRRFSNRPVLATFTPPLSYSTQTPDSAYLCGIKSKHLTLSERTAYRGLEDVVGCKWSAAVVGAARRSEDTATDEMKERGGSLAADAGPSPRARFALTVESYEDAGAEERLRDIVAQWGV
jgi:hypothetical protein